MFFNTNPPGPLSQALNYQQPWLFGHSGINLRGLENQLHHHLRLPSIDSFRGMVWPQRDPFLAERMSFLRKFLPCTQDAEGFLRDDVFAFTGIQ